MIAVAPLAGSLLGSGTAQDWFNSALNLIGTENKEDPRRFAEAQQWFAAAVKGDEVALCRLKYMGGRRGVGTCGGETRGGFATQVAKDYCEVLYQLALATIQSGATSVQIPPAPRPSPGDLQTIATIFQKTSQVTGGVATVMGQPPSPTPQSVGKFFTDNPLMLVLVAGVAIFAIYALRKA